MDDLYCRKVETACRLILERAARARQGLSWTDLVATSSTGRSEKIHDWLVLVL